MHKIELPSFEQKLLAQSGQPIVTLSAHTELMYDSYRINPQGLSATAQQVLSQYSDQQQKIDRLNRWMNVYAQDLVANNVAAKSALALFIQRLGLETTTLMNQQSTLFNRTNCLKVEKATSG
ncbi:MAG TPA: hypothetical protein VFW61_03275 [Acinetobacter sp.]|nr:hypothetical protein [Acinetobacter sp.]